MMKSGKSDKSGIPISRREQPPTPPAQDSGVNYDPARGSASRSALVSAIPPDIATSPLAQTATNDPKLPADVGLCAKCQKRNSLRVKRCHACGEILPWEAERLQEEAQRARSNTAMKKQAAKTGGAAGEMAMTGLLYFLIMVLCFVFPYVGFFIWKYIDAQESKYAGAAFTGWVASIVIIVGLFLLSLLASMAKVGSH